MRTHQRALSVILVLGASACAPTAPLRASGTIELTGGPFVVGESCEGSGDADIVRSGGPIHVLGTDAEGAIATGRIGPGITASDRLCVFRFSVEDIPGGFEQYRVVLGEPGVGILATVEHLDARSVSSPITLRVEP